MTTDAVNIPPLATTGYDGVPKLRRLPDEITCQPIADAVQAHAAAQTAAQQAGATLHVLQHGAALEAERLDARALADAKQAGRKDPGRKHLDAHERQVSEASRHYQAATLIAADRLAELEAAMQEHAGSWRDAVDAKRERAHNEYVDLQRQLQDKATEITAAAATLRFISGERYRTPTPTPSVPASEPQQSVFAPGVNQQTAT